MNVEIGKSFFYRIQKGDDFNMLFEKFNVTKENVLRNNDGIDLYPGEWVKITQNDYISHIVIPTETLEIVAKKYGISAEKIYGDNNLKSSKLFIGQLLKIYK